MAPYSVVLNKIQRNHLNTLQTPRLCRVALKREAFRNNGWCYYGKKSQIKIKFKE